MNTLEFTVATRRRLVTSALAASFLGFTLPMAAQQISSFFTLPIGWPDRVLGDGFWIRHGYACENTWYNPGWWHAGEDWYALDGEETAGAGIFAIGEGTVVFVGSEYPGRVVIVEHPAGLYSMYGHLDHAVAVAERDVVSRGQQLGTVFRRTDGNAPSHLHFEIRAFLFNGRVNGSSPENGVSCGFQCALGPGYWPISYEHPSELGWRNPTHVIAGVQGPSIDDNAAVVVAEDAAPVALVRSVPRVRNGSEVVTEIELVAGASYPLLEIRSGPTDEMGTSAGAYSVWYRIALPAGGDGWVRALIATTDEVASDGRPSALRTDFLVAVEAGGLESGPASIVEDAADVN